MVTSIILSKFASISNLEVVNSPNVDIYLILL